VGGALHENKSAAANKTKTDRFFMPAYLPAIGNQSDDIASFDVNYFGSLGIAVIVTPAVALLGGGTICQANRTAARTGGASRQIPESHYFEYLRRMNVFYREWQGKRKMGCP
jgi:hypothetical protein